MKSARKISEKYQKKKNLDLKIRVFSGVFKSPLLCPHPLLFSECKLFSSSHTKNKGLKKSAACKLGRCGQQERWMIICLTMIGPRCSPSSDHASGKKKASSGTRDTRPDKEGSTGQCHRDFVFFLLFIYCRKVGRKGQVCQEPGRPGVRNNSPRKMQKAEAHLPIT